jgi:hypothetical protein
VTHPPHHPHGVNVLVNQFQFLLHDADLRLRPILFDLLVRVREMLVFLVVMFMVGSLDDLSEQVGFRQLVLVQVLEMTVRVRGRLLSLPVILVHCLMYRFEASVPLSQVGRQRFKVRQTPFVGLVPQEVELQVADVAWRSLDVARPMFVLLEKR